MISSVCLYPWALCQSGLNEKIADSVQISIQRRMFFGLLNLGIFKRRFYVPIIVFSSLLRLGMSVFLGFVTIWVKLPSSAPILWFDVLSLVNWFAGLPSASDVLSEYLQFCLGKSLSSICLGSHASVCCQMSPNVLSEYLQSAWGSYICILCQ